jgi:hypothetical protein
MRRVLAGVLALALCGCGSQPGPLKAVSAEPPAGAELIGKTGTGSPSRASNIPLYRVHADDGSPLSFTIDARNTGSDAVRVTGVVGDEERDGAFKPAGVAGGAVEIAAGAEKPVEIEGEVDGCRFGGQTVPIAGPELRIETGDQERTQTLRMPIRLELVAERC